MPLLQNISFSLLLYYCFIYIKKITIKNFRSIKHQEFECKKFNVFIGKNNHGKSNVFEALDYFFNNTNAESKDDINLLKHKDLQANDIEMELIFGEIEDFVDNIKPEKHKTNFQSSMVKIDDVFQGNEMKCKKKNKEPIKIYINNTEVVEEKKEGKKVGDEVESSKKKLVKIIFLMVFLSISMQGNMLKKKINQVQKII